MAFSTMSKLKEEDYGPVGEVCRLWSGTPLTVTRMPLPSVIRWCAMLKPRGLMLESCGNSRIDLYEDILTMYGFKRLTTLYWENSEFLSPTEDLLRLKKIEIGDGSEYNPAIFELLIKKWQLGETNLQYLKIAHENGNSDLHLNFTNVQLSPIPPAMGWRYTRRLISKDTKKEEAIHGKFYTMRQMNGQNPAFVIQLENYFFFFLRDYYHSFCLRNYHQTWL